MSTSRVCSTGEVTLLPRRRVLSSYIRRSATWRAIAEWLASCGRVTVPREGATSNPSPRSESASPAASIAASASDPLARTSTQNSSPPIR